MAEGSEADSYFDPAEYAIRARLEDHHFWHAHRREVLEAELRRLIGGAAESTPIIELGCGIGTVATHLNGAGFRVDYSEIHAVGLELARRRAEARIGPDLDRRFEPRDITRPLEPLTQSGVLLLDVIEHLPDDVGALRNVRAALPDGKDAFVVVTVPAFNFLWSPWDDMEKHKRRYNPRSLERALETAGFRVERKKFFFLPLFAPALLVKIGRSLKARFTGPSDRIPDIDEMVEFRDRGLVNSLLTQALSLEKPLVRMGGAPVGTSLLAIARPS